MDIKFKSHKTIGTTRCLAMDNAVYVGTTACLDCFWFRKIDIENQVVTCGAKPVKIWKAFKRYLNR